MKTRNFSNHSRVFITSDQHFGHRNIIKYENRLIKMGYKQSDDITDSDIKQHDEELIRRHNSVVGKKDLVIMLGDFQLSSDTEKAKSLLKRLNGSKLLVLGNHDQWYKENLDELIDVVPYLEFKYNNQFIVACHYPIASWNREFHNSYMLFGHCHSMSTEFETDRRIHVGVDTNNYYPVNLADIIK